MIFQENYSLFISSLPFSNVLAKRVNFILTVEMNSSVYPLPLEFTKYIWLLFLMVLVFQCKQSKWEGEATRRKKNMVALRLMEWWLDIPDGSQEFIWMAENSPCNPIGRGWPGRKYGMHIILQLEGVFTITENDYCSHCVFICHEASTSQGLDPTSEPKNSRIKKVRVYPRQVQYLTGMELVAPCDRQS